MNFKSVSAAKAAALVGICAATLECAKLVLMLLPNIEIVSLLCGLYGYVFGWFGVLSSVIFVLIEMMIHGFNTWVVSYLIYWPLLSGVFMLLARARVKNRWILTSAAVVMTIFFGVLTSLIDTGLLTGNFDDFFHRFAVLYASGFVFYIAQIASNAVSYPILFNYIASKLEKVKIRMMKR